MLRDGLSRWGHANTRLIHKRLNSEHAARRLECKDLKDDANRTTLAEQTCVLRSRKLWGIAEAVGASSMVRTLGFVVGGHEGLITGLNLLQSVVTDF